MKQETRIESAQQILREAGRLIIKHLGKSEGHGKRIHVSDEATPHEGYYVQGYGVSPTDQLKTLRVLLPLARRVLNTWAPTLDWCNVARGKAQFIVAYNTEIEDMIQGKLILEEAGGKFTAWTGEPLEIDIRTQQRATFVASNGITHKMICSTLENWA